MEEFKEEGMLCLLASIHESICGLADTKSQKILQDSDLENIQQKLWQVKLTESEILCADIQKSLSQVICAIIRVGKVPDVNDSDVPESTTIDYEVCTNNALYSFHMLLILVKELSKHKVVVHKNAEWLQKAVIIPSLVFVAAYYEVCSWSNEKTAKFSRDLTEEILNLTEYTNLDRLFEGESSIFPDGISKRLMMSFMPDLTRETWKQNPTTKTAFAWCLTKIKHPHLGTVLSEVLPPPLLFIDDYVLENKILGVHCLHHIIQNVAPAELKWFGRSEVLYNALEHLMYTHEADLISVLHPCLLSILRVVEDDPTKPSSLAKISRYDKVLEKILTDMELEQRLVLRRAFAQCIFLFIEKMGINTVRHIKHLLRVISEYLEVYDGPEERARSAMLIALKSLIITTWPRIPYHMETVLKVLVKFIYDIHASSAQIGEKERLELVQLAGECFELLKKADPNKFQLLCEPLLEVEQNIPGREVFGNIIEVSI